MSNLNIINILILLVNVLTYPTTCRILSKVTIRFALLMWPADHISLKYLALHAVKFRASLKCIEIYNVVQKQKLPEFSLPGGQTLK